MKNLYIILLAFIINANLFSQVHRDAELITYSLEELSYLFGYPMFDATKMNYTGNVIKDEIESTHLGSATYNQAYPNFFTENFRDEELDLNYYLIIGVSNHTYKIYVYRGVHNMRLVATITFDLVNENYGESWDNLINQTWTPPTWTHINRSFIWTKDPNIIMTRGIVPNIPDYLLVYHAEYTNTETLKKVAVAFNPLSELQRKSNSFSGLYNILLKRSKI